MRRLVVLLVLVVREISPKKGCRCLHARVVVDEWRRRKNVKTKTVICETAEDLVRLAGIILLPMCWGL